MSKSNDNISECRSEVIEKFINIETIINGIISQHYFKQVRWDFYFNVLYDEYFTFALRRRILKKIIPSINNKKLEKLNRLNNIRNYFAHCGAEIFEGTAVPAKDIKGRIPKPSKPSESLDFQKLHEIFIRIEPEITEYLFKLFKEIGGIAEKAI